MLTDPCDTAKAKSADRLDFSETADPENSCLTLEAESNGGQKRSGFSRLSSQS